MLIDWFKSSLIILGILISFYSSGQERCFNTDTSFSFIPLENWENFSKGNGLTFAQQKDSEVDNFRENIKLDVSPANGFSLDELWNSYVVRDFPKSFEKFKMVQMWNSNVNEKEAKWIEFTNYSSGLKFRNLVYMLVENDRMYFIICSALDKDFDKTEDEFLKMVNSFEIN